MILLGSDVCYHPVWLLEIPLLGLCNSHIALDKIGLASGFQQPLQLSSGAVNSPAGESHLGVEIGFEVECCDKQHGRGAVLETWSHGEKLLGA